MREQIRIAEGEPLGYEQSDLAINGHSVGSTALRRRSSTRFFCRPPGVLKVWRPSDSARFDSGVSEGSEVNVEFDPMIAKVITHGATRREAVAKLARALETTSIQGIRNNRDFLVATLRTPEFIAGDTTTDFIDRVQPTLAYTPQSARIG